MCFLKIIRLRKKKWHWNSKTQNIDAGYAQVVKVDNVIYISGVLTNNITPEGITALYNNLEKVLASFGATFENVVKENLYTTEIESMKKYNDMRKKFYRNDFPAATWILNYASLFQLKQSWTIQRLKNLKVVLTNIKSQ